MYLNRSFTSPDLWEQAKDQRKNPTAQEHALWQEVRCKRLGVRIHRQKVIAGFIVDFWCPKALLAIELDGPTHHLPENMARDAWRDQLISDMGITVMRYPVDTPIPVIVASLRAQIAERYFAKKPSQRSSIPTQEKRRV